MSDAVRTAVVRAALLAASAASVCATAYIVVSIVERLQRQPMAPWVLGRASGFASYALMVVLVLSGLLLSHPAAARLTWPAPSVRMRLHVTLAIFTLVFTVLHIVVLATDSYADVGWRGSFLPMASHYRPVGVTLGVVALWAGLVTGVTASLAGRWAGRLWWPIHKVAVVLLALVWAHGFWTGIDTPSARWYYLATGSTVVLAAVSRYVARRPSDLIDTTSAAPTDVTTLAMLMADVDGLPSTDETPRQPRKVWT
jgi:DMSO/TMAO reductase YedYZ heme-binding membrane subunit